MSIKLYDKSGGTPQEVLLAGTPATDLILNGTSKNPIANKTVYNALATKIESTVENLVNFYNKSQVYNKQEVRDLIGAINTLTIEVVNELPTQDISATTIYFLKQSGANTYDEYIYVDNAWVKIGDTDIDLSGYLTTANFQIAIADYYTKSAIDAMIANYYTKAQVDAMVDAKQDELTFDNAPTAGSDNPVKSGGIKTALDAKQNTLTFDSTPTASSSNPVTSDGIKDAIDDTAADVYEVMGKNGAKNLLPYNLNELKRLNTSGTWNGASYTNNGVTFAINSDNTISTSGTASARFGFTIYLDYDARNMIMSGCPQGGARATYSLQYSNYSDQSFADIGNGYTIPSAINTGTWRVVIWIESGAVLDNLTFKPMIRLASDTDSTYQPYAMTNQQLTPIAQSITNPNLLDNPWFTINQRGVTNSWTTQFSIGVDRWRKQTANNTLQVTNNGISATTSSVIGLYQVYKQSTMKDLYGKTLTFSIMYGDGTIESGSDLLPLDHYAPSSTKVKQFLSNTTRCNYIQTESYSNGNINIVFNTKADTVIKAVKLEIGSVSTLYLDTAPNYATELLKCQRYFVRVGGVSSGYPIAVGRAHNSTQGRYLIHLPVPMRSNAIVTCSDFTKVRELCNHQQSTPTSFTAGSMEGGGYVGFYTTTTGLVTDELCGLMLNAEYLDISADL